MKNCFPAKTPSVPFPSAPYSGPGVGWAVVEGRSGRRAAVEMDVPLAEELEWLESAFLDEEESVEEFEEELREASGAGSVDDGLDAPFQSSEFQESSRKRPSSLEPKAAPDISSEEKRRKWSAAEDDEEEEDTIHCSPSKDQSACNAPTHVDAAVDVAMPDELSPAVAEERFLSRFASEIDGDCIPVTGPCGERVYAKMCAEAIVSVPKKLRLERSG